MNDRQKTFIIIGLVLFLFIIAHHLLFVEKLREDLLQVEDELRAEEYAESLFPAGDDMTPGMDIANLERKLQVTIVLRYVLVLIGLAAFAASYLCRERGGQNPFEDEWEDDEQEEDDA